MRPPDEPSVIAAGAELVARLGQLSERLAARIDPLIGSASVFVGQIHSGEIFNQYPRECWLEGTRRWLPNTPSAEVERAFCVLLAELARDTGTTVDLTYTFIRDAFRLEPSDPVVQAFQQAYTTISGQALPLGPKPFVDDGSSFYGLKNLPAITHGPRAGGQHTVKEWVDINDLVRVAHLYASTAVLYWPATIRIITMVELKFGLRTVDVPYMIRLYGVSDAMFDKLVDEDTKAELIDGVMIVHSPATLRHDDVAGFLRTLMRCYTADKGLGRVLGPDGLVRIKKRRRIGADIFFLTQDRVPKPLPKEYKGVPNLFIEVLSLPSNRDYDLNEKRPLYREAGVKEIWLVDPQKQQIILDRRRGQRLRHQDHPHWPRQVRCYTRFLDRGRLALVRSAAQRDGMLACAPPLIHYRCPHDDRDLARPDLRVAQTTEEAVPAAHLRPRSDGGVVEAAAGHGPGRRRPLLGRGRQTLPRRPVRHLRRLGRPQQSPRHRRPAPAARHRCTSRRRCTAPIRWRCNWRTYCPSWRPATNLGRSSGRLDGEVPVRRLGGHRGGDQAGPAVSQADRLARQVQDHQPLPVLARLDARLAVGVGPQVAQDRQRAAGSRLPARLSADLLSLPVRQKYPDCGITCATLIEKA